MPVEVSDCLLLCSDFRSANIRKLRKLRTMQMKEMISWLNNCTELRFVRVADQLLKRRFDRPRSGYLCSPALQRWDQRPFGSTPALAGERNIDRFYSSGSDTSCAP